MVQGPTGPHSSGPPADGPQNEPKESKALSFREQAVQSILEGLEKKEKPISQVIGSIQDTGYLNKAEAIKIVRQVTQEMAKKHPSKPNTDEENQNIASIMSEMNFDVEDVKEAIEVDDPSREPIFIKKAELEHRKTYKPLDQIFKAYGVDKRSWLEYPSTAVKSIKKLLSGKKDQQTLIDMNMRSAKIDGRKTSESIQHSGINRTTEKGQKGLIDIAKAAARQNGRGTVFNFKNYGIDWRTPEAQKALLEIAEIIAEHDAIWLVVYRENLEINWETPEAQKLFIKILKMIAEENGKWVAENIQNLGLDESTKGGQDALIEILKIAVKQNPEAVAQHFHNFKINWNTPERQKVLIEILKTAINSSPSKIAPHFYNFKITWKTPEAQKALIEIAEIIAERNGFWLAQNIQHLEIDRATPEGKKNLIEIFRIASLYETYSLGIFIQNLKLNWTNPEEIKFSLELIKIIAPINDTWLAENVQNLGIDESTKEGQDALIEILKMARLHLDVFIQNLGIDWKNPEAQKALIETVKHFSPFDFLLSASFIKNIGIDWKTPEGTKFLIEILQITAEQINCEFLSLALELDIDWKTPEGTKFLIEILKIAAGQKRWGLIPYIQNLKLDWKNPEAQKGLIEIFKIALLTHGFIVCRDIQQFGIIDKKERSSLLLLALENDPSSLFYATLFELDLPNFDKKNHFSDPSMLREFCKPFLAKLPSLDKEIESITDRHSREIVKEKAILTAVIFLVCKLKEFPFEKVVEQVNELNDLRNPTLRSDLGKAVISQLAKAQSIDEHKNFSNSHKGLSSLTSSCLCSLQAQGADPKALSVLANTIQNKKAIFKDTFAKQKLFQAITALVKDDTLPINNKLEILQFALNGNDKKSILRLLGGISSIYLLVGNLNSLKDVRSEESFNQVYFQAFQSVIPVADIQNFSEKFEKSFEEFRDTTALFTYAATLNKLPEQEKAPLLEKLAFFVSEVIEGTLSASRYETEHLNTIFATDTALKEKWTQGSVAPFAPAEEESEAPKLPDFENLVETSLREGHHGDVELPFLQGEKNQEELIKASKNKDLSKEERDLLNFQKHLINLKNATDSKHALSIIDLCLKHLPEKIKRTQLASDIQGWKTGLAEQSTKSDFEGWTIVDGDDPCDLLLCGTEVAGSCQRVNGSPSLNKCLLAYLLDGKNRLITIKNKSGVIKARSILRLLFDGVKPVLFLERIYPAILDDKKRNSLIEFAKARAKNLGLPLLSREVGSGESYEKEIRSLGGPAPFEYVDASNGVNANSVWSIYGAHVLKV